MVDHGWVCGLFDPPEPVADDGSLEDVVAAMSRPLEDDPAGIRVLVMDLMDEDGFMVSVMITDPLVDQESTPRVVAREDQNNSREVVVAAEDQAFAVVERWCGGLDLEDVSEFTMPDVRARDSEGWTREDLEALVRIALWSAQWKPQR